MTDKAETPFKVLYIGGATRSGSTLLEMILGNIPGFFSVGEVRYLWEHLEKGDVQCGCGALLANCEFWSQVLAQMDANYPIDIERFAFLSRTIDRTRNLFWLSWNKYPFGADEFQEYIEITQHLHDAIRCICPDKIIVDSSKVPSHIYLLKKIKNLDVRLLHLVRDARAVAYSWNKRQKQELAITGEKSWMPKRSMYTAIAAWAVEHHFMLKLSRSVNYYALLRYEDYSLRPYSEIDAALNSLGFSDLNLKVLESNSLDLKANHSVNGNPIRFKKGAIKINSDQEWRQKLPRPIQFMLGIPIKPLLRKFGYQL